MSSASAPSLSRALLFALAGLAGGAAGWFGHAASSSGHPAPRFAAIAPSPAPTATLAPPAAAPANADPRAILDRLLFAESSDMVNLMEAIGELTRLDEPGVRLAWRMIGERPPLESMGGSSAVIYLWSRLVALGESADIPRGWGAENFASTIALAQVREQLPRLLSRLESGESLDEAERRAVFTEIARTDPLGAIKLWTATTPPWDFRGDARWLGPALADPSTREAAMAELRRWQKDGDLGGATLALAWDWIARDPAAVEAWLREPAQADVRDHVMQQVLNVRVLADPASAANWSRALPDSERRRALGMSAAQLANRDPEAGARLVADLQAPAEREEAIRSYGKTLAANDLERWKTWRDGLPETERAQANEAAFDLWAFYEPDAAVRWLDSRPAGAARDDLVLTLVDVYAQRDPAVAAKWIQGIGDPARRDKAAVAALAGAGPENLDTVRTILAATGRVN